MNSLGIKSVAPRWLSVFAMVAVAGCGGSSTDTRSINQSKIAFSTSLTSQEETPPNSSQARGVGLLIFDPLDRSFTASVVTSGMQDTDAHIHQAPPGQPGPIIFPMTKDPGSVVWSTRGTLDPAQEQTLRAGNYYFNVHSPTFPAGEIRGQIERRVPTDTQLQQLQRIQQTSQQLQQQLQQVRQMQQAR